jgi:hypothetical protein
MQDEKLHTMKREKKGKMKKKITTIVAAIAACLYAGTACAQIGEQRHNFAIGVNGGVNYNTVSFDRHSVKQSGLMGTNAGITLRYISEKYFAMICGLQVELNYSQRGWDKKFELDDGSKDPSRGFTREMNYIEVPFLAHLAFGHNYGFQAFLNLGPQVAYLLNDSKTYFGLSDEDLQSEEYSLKIQNKFDYGITGGLGMEIRTRKAGSFIVEGRYYYGLADFFDSEKKDYFSRSSHSTITGKITYLFDIKK